MHNLSIDTEFNKTKIFNYFFPEIEESSLMKNGSPRTAAALEPFTVKKDKICFQTNFRIFREYKIEMKSKRVLSEVVGLFMF